jgi:hypothetical protein
LIAPAVAVLGLLLIAVGAISPWGLTTPTKVTASHTVAKETQVLVIDPGVLDAMNGYADAAKPPEVTVTVTPPKGQAVVLAKGRETDVAAWVGDSQVEKLTGLKTLDSFTATETGTGTVLPAAEGSDLWLAEKTFTEAGEHKWQPKEGRWSLLIAPAGTGSSVVGTVAGTKLTVTWDGLSPTKPFRPWGLAIGIILVVAAAILLIVQARIHRYRQHQAEREAARAAGQTREAGPAVSRREEPAEATQVISLSKLPAAEPLAPGGQVTPSGKAEPFLSPETGAKASAGEATVGAAWAGAAKLAEKKAARAEKKAAKAAAKAAAQAAAEAASAAGPAPAPGASPVPAEAGAPAGSPGTASGTPGSLAKPAASGPETPPAADLLPSPAAEGAGTPAPGGDAAAPVLVRRSPLWRPEDEPAGQPAAPVGEAGEPVPEPSPEPAGPEPAPAAKRGWFKRRRQRGSEPAPPEAPTLPEPPAPDQGLDLGLATPVRTWERLAHAKPQHLEPPEEPAVQGQGLAVPGPVLTGPAGYQTPPRPATGGPSPAAPSGQPTGLPPSGPVLGPVQSGPAAKPHRPGLPDRPLGPPSVPAPSQWPMPRPPAASPGVAPAPAAGPAVQPVAATPAPPPFGGLPQPVRGIVAPSAVDQTPAPVTPVTGRAAIQPGQVRPPTGSTPVVSPAARPPVQVAPARAMTAEEQLAALTAAHSSRADDAAATISAAMAAAAGRGSTEGLTRKQIREAERAAAEALRLSRPGQTQLPEAWQGPVSRPAGVPRPKLRVRMQGEEAPGQEAQS